MDEEQNSISIETLDAGATLRPDILMSKCHGDQRKQTHEHEIVRWFKMVGSPYKTSNKTTCTWNIAWVGQPFPGMLATVTTRIGDSYEPSFATKARGTNQYISVIYTANKG